MFKIDATMAAIKKLAESGSLGDAQALAELIGVKLRIDDKSFKQPPAWDFSVYDPSSKKTPDTSTPLKVAMIALEDEVRNDHLETGAFFSDGGSVLVRRQGEPNTIKFTKSELKLGIGRSFSHNHPNGGNFSLDDIELAAILNLREIRVVTPHMRYSLSRIKSWPAPMAVIASEAQISALAQVKVDLLLKEGALRKEYAQVEIEHHFWSIFAFLFNVEYRRERS